MDIQGQRSHPGIACDAHFLLRLPTTGQQTITLCVLEQLVLVRVLLILSKPSFRREI